MKIEKSTIGIWGFGRVGKSAASFFHHRNARVIVYDDNQTLSANSPYLTVPSREALFNSTDYILPSPGIDTHHYRALYQGTWLCELDIFQQYFKKPVIAITGSVGKTTVTHILANLLQQYGIRALAAGNIGTPMLDLIDQQDLLDMIVLELSSFQLEYAVNFAPQLAIITNVYPNHLDRHGTMEEYLAAKMPIFKHQTRQQWALIPHSLQSLITPYQLQSTITFFAKECPQTTVAHSLFCYDGKKNILHHHQSSNAILLDHFPSMTFPENWLIIWTALNVLGISYKQTNSIASLEHRLEKVTEINGVIFYNDSKSTTPTSTLAALEQFKDKRMVLFLGGLNKGIDRAPLIQALTRYNVQIVSFGKEATAIKALCDSCCLAAHDFATLEQAFQSSTHLFTQTDCVLFSPSGSSYDLFADYQERGTVFKNLVMNYKKRIV
jgi:UDP-N-acetylmuramoylalanine--D-glutamate ligase